MIDRARHIWRLLRRTAPQPPMVGEFDAGPAYQQTAHTVRMRRPIVAGMLVLILFVAGLLLWAAVAPIYGAVLAPGQVRVEGNSKQIRRLEGGVIRRIFVHEGQRVARGQLLIRFDNTTTLAGVQIYQAGSDDARAQIARYQAEAVNAGDVAFPADLVARSGDPRVAALLSSQRNLFLSRMLLYRSQTQVLGNQVQQLDNQIAGLQAQVASTDGQSDLIQDELQGVRQLNQEGYAPRTRLLALQRSAVALKGQRGSLRADIARASQAIGSVRLQLAQLDDKRQTDAAEGIRAAQAVLTENDPKLRAAQEALNQVEIRSPVDGYVFNLTQFTEGGVAGSGELLMNIVPIGTKLYITTKVKTNEISDVKVGAKARITLTAYNPRTTPQVDGRVVLVGADAVDDPQARETYYQVRVEVDPSELAKAGPKVRLTPGMPALVAIVTGQRTILSYLLGPLTESMHSALRER